jgi:hypothetical protein
VDLRTRRYLWTRDESSPRAEIRTSDRPARSLVTLLTTLSRLVVSAY